MKKGLIERVTDAITSFKGEDDLSRHNVLSLESPELKSQAMPHDGYNGNWDTGSQDMAGALRQIFNRMLSGTQIDYAAEVGNPIQNSLIRAAINWVGRTLPEAPIRTVEPDAAGDKNVPVKLDALAPLIRRPNPYYSGSTLWKSFSLSWIVDGNVYWYKLRNLRGQVFQLWPIPHFMITPRWPVGDDSIYISHYDYCVNGRIYQLDPRDVVHFRDGSDPDNSRRGLSPVGALLREIFTDISATNYSAALMKHAGIPPVIISPKEGVNAVNVNLKELTDLYVRRTAGDERGKPLAAPVGIDVHKLSFDPEEMDLSSLHDTPAERVAAVLGIPPIVLGFKVGLDHGTFSNYEQASASAYETHNVPLWRYIGEEVTVQLLSEVDADESHSAEHDLSRVRALQDDQDNLFKRWGMAYQYGFAKRSESRSATGLKSKPADDVYITDVKAAQAKLVAAAATPQPDAQQQDGQEPTKARGKRRRFTLVRKDVPFEHEEKDAHKFGTTQVDLNGPEREEILAYAAEIPDEWLAEQGRESEPHITVKYGLHTQDFSEVTAALEAEAPVEVEFGDTSVFRADGYAVIIVTVESDGLRRLNARLSQSLEHTDTHPEYVPHVTVAYVKADKYQEALALRAQDFMTGSEATFDRITFSNQNGARSTINLMGAQS
jgi:HK97 family phage portal protein